MSLAELKRGTFLRERFDNESSPRWVNEFVEVMAASEMEASGDVIPHGPAVNSKVLFLIAAELPYSDRLQVNIGRFLQHRHAHTEGAWHVDHDATVSELGVSKVDHPTAGNRPEKERILQETARLLSTISQQPQNELVEVLRWVLLGPHSYFALAKTREVVLETFEGYVDNVDGETAYVQLKSREHGDVLYGNYPTSQLAAKGIDEQSRFLCQTIKVDGSTRVDLRALPDVDVTDEDLRAIEEKIDRVLPHDDPGIEY